VYIGWYTRVYASLKVYKGVYTLVYASLRGAVGGVHPGICLPEGCIREVYTLVYASLPYYTSQDR